MNKYWIEFQIQTPFLEAVSAYIGINNLDVIKRYIKIWDMFEKGKVPDKYVVELKAKPINELTPIMGCVLQAGYEVTDENWEMLLHTRGNVPLAVNPALPGGTGDVLVGGASYPGHRRRVIHHECWSQALAREAAFPPAIMKINELYSRFRNVST